MDPNPCDWCIYKRRKLVHTYTHGRHLRTLGDRWLSTNQGERPQKKPTDCRPQDSRTVESKLLLFKSSSLWYSVLTALGNESVQFSYSVVSDSLWPHGLQHARLPCPSPTSRDCSNSSPSSRWCHPTISSSAVPFSFCLQPFPAERLTLFQWVSSLH